MEPLFAFLHFLSILALAGALAAEWVLCNEHLQPGHVRLLVRVDLAYLLAAIAVVATGLVRFVWFAKGPGFYLSNPIFHLKIALFIAVGLISVAPTLQFIRWNRALKEGRTRVVSGAEIRRTRRFLGLEFLLFAFIPLTAVSMARGLSPS